MYTIDPLQLLRFLFCTRDSLFFFLPYYSCSLAKMLRKKKNNAKYMTKGTHSPSNAVTQVEVKGMCEGQNCTAQSMSCGALPSLWCKIDYTGIRFSDRFAGS